jgi:hypothetical protein
VREILFVAYHAGNNSGKWTCVPSSEKHQSTEVMRWAIEEIGATMQNRRRAWLYWPYWNAVDFDFIQRAIETIRLELAKHSFDPVIKDRLRKGQPPVPVGRLREVKETHCFVYYVDPLSER